MEKNQRLLTIGYKSARVEGTLCPGVTTRDSGGQAQRCLTLAVRTWQVLRLSEQRSGVWTGRIKCSRCGQFQNGKTRESYF